MHRLASCPAGASVVFDGTRGTISQISVTFDFRAFGDLHLQHPNPPAGARLRFDTPNAGVGVLVWPAAVRMLLVRDRNSREHGQRPRDAAALSALCARAARQKIAHGRLMRIPKCQASLARRSSR